MKIRFNVERETKNTIRFAEDAPEGAEAIGILYVRKSALEKIGHDGKSSIQVEISRG